MESFIRGHKASFGVAALALFAFWLLDQYTGVDGLGEHILSLFVTWGFLASFALMRQAERYEQADKTFTTTVSITTEPEKENENVG
jgi:hypothetical protein